MVRREPGEMMGGAALVPKPAGGSDKAVVKHCRAVTKTVVMQLSRENFLEVPVRQDT